MYDNIVSTRYSSRLSFLHPYAGRNRDVGDTFQLAIHRVYLSYLMLMQWLQLLDYVSTRYSSRLSFLRGDYIATAVAGSVSTRYSSELSQEF